MVLFIFKSERSHKEFQNHLFFLLNLYYANDHFFKTVFLNATIILKVFFTDLVSVRKILLPTYHPPLVKNHGILSAFSAPTG